MNQVMENLHVHMKLQFLKYTVSFSKIFFLVFAVVICTASCSTSNLTVRNITTESNVEDYSFSLQQGELCESEYLYKNIPKPTSKETIYVSFDSNKKNSHYSFKVKNINLVETQNYISTLEENGITKQLYDVYDKNDYPILNFKGVTKDNIIITISQSDTVAVIGITVTNK